MSNFCAIYVTCFSNIIHLFCNDIAVNDEIIYGWEHKYMALKFGRMHYVQEGCFQSDISMMNAYNAFYMRLFPLIRMHVGLCKAHIRNHWKDLVYGAPRMFVYVMLLDTC